MVALQVQPLGLIQVDTTCKNIYSLLGHARIPSRTEYLGETVTNLTVKARTIPYNWSSSKSSTESTNKEVEQMERVIGYIDEQDIDSASER